MTNFTMVKYFCTKTGTFEMRRVVTLKGGTKRYLKLDEASMLLVKIRQSTYIQPKEARV